MPHMVMVFMPLLVCWCTIELIMTRRSLYQDYRIPLLTVVRIALSIFQVWITEQVGDVTLYTAKHLPRLEVSMVLRFFCMTQSHNTLGEVFGFQLPMPLQAALVYAKGVVLFRAPYTLKLVAVSSGWAYWQAAQRVHAFLHAALVVVPCSLLVSDGCGVEAAQQCTPCAALILLLMQHLATPSLLLYRYHVMEARNRRVYAASGRGPGGAPRKGRGDARAGSDDDAGGEDAGDGASAAAGEGEGLGQPPPPEAEADGGGGAEAGGSADGQQQRGAAAAPLLAAAGGERAPSEPLTRSAGRHACVVFAILRVSWALAHWLALDALPRLLPPSHYARLCPAGPMIGPALGPVR